MLAAMQRDGKSERLRTQVLIILRSALTQALKWDIVLRNVAQAVDKPRVVRREMLTLSRDQAQRFLRAAEGSRFFALYVLALMAGLRRGELLGLQWSDVSFEDASLSVVRSIVTLGGAPSISETKTAKGRRRIDLPQTAVRALREQQALLFAKGLRTSPWIFPNEDGAPMSPRNLIRRSFVPILKKAQAELNAEAGIGEKPDLFPSIRFHDLRHTAASLMLELGVHPKVVQERLGHSSIAVTMDTYSHVLPSMQQDAASRVDAMFSGLKTKSLA